jgi:zinc finger HIT domain-containing protein 3
MSQHEPERTVVRGDSPSNIKRKQHDAHAKEKPRRRGMSRKTSRPRSSGHADTNEAVFLSTATCCSVCHDSPAPKYKCPTCRATYCSVACCRSHKLVGCCGGEQEKVQPEEKVVGSTPTIKSKYRSDILATATVDVRKREKSSRIDDDSSSNLPEGWKITDEMKEQIDTSVWIQCELADAGLRQCLVDIYHARIVGGGGDVRKRRGPLLQHHRAAAQQETNQEIKCLEQIKAANPAFRNFMDKLLVVAGVLERQGEDVSVALDQWLSSSEERNPLFLKPLERRRHRRPSLSSSSGSSGKKDRCENGVSSSNDETANVHDSSDSGSSCEEDDESR